MGKNIAYTQTLGEIKFLHFLFFVIGDWRGGATSEQIEGNIVFSPIAKWTQTDFIYRGKQDIKNIVITKKICYDISSLLIKFTKICQIKITKAKYL